MLPRAGKEFLVRIRINMRPIFQGRYLLLTNTLSGGVMLAIGDYLQQTREIYKEPKRVREWRRTRNMFLVGLSFGPILHYWYIWLDKVFAGRTIKTVVKKVLMDQLIASPIIGMWFFVGMGLVQGHTLSEGLREYKRMFWQFYKADWCVWPAAQMINFYYLSPKYRILYINCVTLGWDVYLSHLKHKNSHPDAATNSSGIDVQQEAIPSAKPLKEKD
ncbi:mpv17-like protein 2 [Brachionichthys hirsutus]|uniref:mpv17-like protein 2 n=1 Tax=Brachionichthys hirsutus TaxID=412623 RepID=UPI003605324D